MPLTIPSVPSDSSEPTSKLAALTAQFRESVQTPPSDAPPPAWVQTIEQNLTASLTNVGDKICTGLVVRAAQERYNWREEQQSARMALLMSVKRIGEEDRANAAKLMRQLTKTAIIVVMICASAVPLTYAVTLAQYHYLDKVRAEVIKAEEDLIAIKTRIAKLSPIARWQIVQSESAPTPSVKILPRSVRETPEGTFAEPELKAEK